MVPKRPRKDYHQITKETKPTAAQRPFVLVYVMGAQEPTFVKVEEDGDLEMSLDGQTLQHTMHREHCIVVCGRGTLSVERKERQTYVKGTAFQKSVAQIVTLHATRSSTFKPCTQSKLGVRVYVGDSDLFTVADGTVELSDWVFRMFSYRVDSDVITPLLTLVRATVHICYPDGSMCKVEYDRRRV